MNRLLIRQGRDWDFMFASKQKRFPSDTTTYSSESCLELGDCYGQGLRAGQAGFQIQIHKARAGQIFPWTAKKISLKMLYN